MQDNLDARPLWFIFFEASGILAYLITVSFTLNDLVQTPPTSFFTFLFSLIFAMIMADFFSGIVHYIADNIGDENTFILGPALIRPFREHHIYPNRITEHDFIETNGSLYLVGAITLGLSLYYDFFILFTFIFTIFQVNTNQIHKWAHQRRPNIIAQKLMKLKIILSQQEHSKHHSGDIDSHYCITTGWLNEILFPKKDKP